MTGLELDLELQRHARQFNRKGHLATALQGRRTGSRPYTPGESCHPVDLAKTISQAVLRRVQSTSASEALLKRQDIHLQVRSQKPRRLIVFTVDTSDSMGDGPCNRMAAALGAIISLAATAYLNRDQVCLIAFRDREATLVVPPTNSVTLIRQQLNRLPVGGATPLTAGLTKARQIISQQRLKNPHLTPLLVLVSDGDATTSLKIGTDPTEEALSAARQLAREDINALVIDTLSAQSKTGKMSQLAESLGCRCHHISNLQAGNILELIAETKT